MYNYTVATNDCQLWGLCYAIDT